MEDVTDSPPASVRTIAGVDELKALSDPTRLAILEALMLVPGPDLPVMSVKELAEVLGEPQTKLYRHIRQLESVGLIKVAATRMVSGILEQRYQAAQRDLHLAPLSPRENIDEVETVARAMVSLFSDGFFAAHRAWQEAAGPDSPGSADSESKTSLMQAVARLTPAKAAEVRAKLAEVLACFDEPCSDVPDAPEMTVLIGYYTRPRRDGR